MDQKSTFSRTALDGTCVVLIVAAFTLAIWSIFGNIVHDRHNITGYNISSSHNMDVFGETTVNNIHQLKKGISGGLPLFFDGTSVVAGLWAVELYVDPVSGSNTATRGLAVDNALQTVSFALERLRDYGPRWTGEARVYIVGDTYNLGENTQAWSLAALPESTAPRTVRIMPLAPPATVATVLVTSALPTLIPPTLSCSQLQTDYAGPLTSFFLREAGSGVSFAATISGGSVLVTGRVPWVAGTSLELYTPGTAVHLASNSTCMLESAFATTLVVDGLSFDHGGGGGGGIAELQAWGGKVSVENCLLSFGLLPQPLRFLAPNTCTFVNTVTEGHAPPTAPPTNPDILLEDNMSAIGCVFVNTTIEPTGGELQILGGSLLVDTNINAHTRVQVSNCHIQADHLRVFGLHAPANVTLLRTNLLVNSSVAELRGGAKIVCTDYALASPAPIAPAFLFSASGPGSRCDFSPPATLGGPSMNFIGLEHGAGSSILNLNTPNPYLGQLYSLDGAVPAPFVSGDFPGLPGSPTQVIKTAGGGITKLITGNGHVL
jgi:hypothetical protein